MADIVYLLTTERSYLRKEASRNHHRATAERRVPGRCREKSIIYKATVDCNSFGTAKRSLKRDTLFKCNPSSTVWKETPRNFPTWSCTDAGNEPNITWSIVCLAKPYQQGAKQCQLCLAEKYFILTAETSTTLNKQTELINKSRCKTNMNNCMWMRHNR